MAHTTIYKKKAYPKGVRGGVSGGFSTTELYSGSSQASSITLDDAMSNYEYIHIMACNPQDSTLYWRESFYRVADLAIGNRIGIVDDGSYLWYSITDDTHLTRQNYGGGSYYITSICGMQTVRAGGGGGGGSLIVKPCYAEFKGWPSSFIDTHIGQMDAEYYLDFYINSYENDKAILGNSSGSSYLHLTMYSNKWYTSNGSGEFSFGDSTMITGRHTYTYNRVSDRKIVFDNTEVGTSNGYENGDFTIRLNNRNGNMCCASSRIYEFKITARDGTVLHDFKPVAIYQGNTLIWKGIRDEAGGMVLDGWCDVVEISS